MCQLTKQEIIAKENITCFKFVRKDWKGYESLVFCARYQIGQTYSSEIKSVLDHHGNLITSKGIHSFQHLPSKPYLGVILQCEIPKGSNVLIGHEESNPDRETYVSNKIRIVRELSTEEMINYVLYNRKGTC